MERVAHPTFFAGVYWNSFYRRGAQGMVPRCSGQIESELSIPGLLPHSDPWKSIQHLGNPPASGNNYNGGTTISYGKDNGGSFEGRELGLKFPINFSIT